MGPRPCARCPAIERERATTSGSPTNGCAPLFTTSRRRADTAPRFPNNIRRSERRRPLISSPAWFLVSTIIRDEQALAVLGALGFCMLDDSAHFENSAFLANSALLSAARRPRTARALSQLSALVTPTARSPHACTRCFLIDSLHSECRSTVLRRAIPPRPSRPRGHPAQNLLTLQPQDRLQGCCLMARLHPEAAPQSAKSARQPPTTAIATPPACDRSIRRESASTGVRVGNGRG